MDVFVSLLVFGLTASLTVFREAEGRKSPGRHFGKFYRHKEINNYLENTAIRYPDRVKLGKIGKSSEGRDLEVIQLSPSLARSANRSAILVVGGIHGSEWITPALALYITQQLVLNRTNKDLVDSVDWFILPLLNPDGYEYSLNKDRTWMKSRSRTLNSQCIGVSLERNFDFHWNETGSISEPCSEVYAGPEAFSEPETRALRDFTLEHKNRIKLYIELQSSGSNIVYPWSYTMDPPDTIKLLEEVANVANEALIAAGDNGYSIGSYAKLLSPTSGIPMDWMKGSMGIPLSYTVKIATSPAKHAIPEKFIKSTISKFFPAVRAFGTYVKQHY